MKNSKKTWIKPALVSALSVKQTLGCCQEGTDDMKMKADDECKKLGVSCA